MGWSSGSRIFSEIAETVSRYVTDNDSKEEIFRTMIESFESADCDTLSECEGIDVILDSILEELGYIDSEDLDYTVLDIDDEED